MDILSNAEASRIDTERMDSGMPDDGLRIVRYYISGNRSRSFLTAPGDDNAPCYEYLTHNPETGDHSPAYYHRFGPTLADWQAQREATEASREARELYEWASGR